MHNNLRHQDAHSTQHIRRDVRGALSVQQLAETVLGRQPQIKANILVNKPLHNARCCVKHPPPHFQPNIKN